MITLLVALQGLGGESLEVADHSFLVASRSPPTTTRVQPPPSHQEGEPVRALWFGLILNEMENAMRTSKFTQCWKYLESGTIIFVMVSIMGAIVSPVAAPAQDKKDEISFDLVPNPQFVDCLRKSSYAEPKARATVIRGKLNDTMILDLDGFKPGLAFDLFTVQRSPFLSDKTPDLSFKGSFGLAWYQSDIEIAKHSDDGHVRIKTILLDQIFGFDPDASLPPTNTFHVGFWFNNPQDAAACGFPANDPTKLTPFNGEHKAGPFAMISVPDQTTQLGPLCTDPDPAHPGSCNP